MEKLEELSCFISQVASDLRMRPTHIAVSVALYHAWSSNGFQNAFNISRRQLMHAARIRSIATYHKVVRDLQAFGHLDYCPSYHPVNGSLVSLKVHGRSRKISAPPFDVAA
jgi:hypothetical protein